ncbi:MAG TPA: hypothetical protein PKC98_18040, partial [Candidatus Melainabacteria bacterium]|nr:hypothetical protein [Candidatus Melainabacteria bacterium]
YSRVTVKRASTEPGGIYMQCFPAQAFAAAAIIFGGAYFFVLSILIECYKNDRKSKATISIAASTSDQLAGL